MSRAYLIRVVFEDNGHGGDRWIEYCLVHSDSAKKAIDMAKMTMPKGIDYTNVTYF